MLAVQPGLTGGVDLGGLAIDPPTRALIGVGLDPTSAGNLLELGIDADTDGPAPEIKVTRGF